MTYFHYPAGFNHYAKTPKGGRGSTATVLCLKKSHYSRGSPGGEARECQDQAEGSVWGHGENRWFRFITGR